MVKSCTFLLLFFSSQKINKYTANLKKKQLKLDFGFSFYIGTRILLKSDWRRLGVLVGWWRLGNREGSEGQNRKT